MERIARNEAVTRNKWRLKELLRELLLEHPEWINTLNELKTYVISTEKADSNMVSYRVNRRRVYETLLAKRRAGRFRKQKVDRTKKLARVNAAIREKHVKVKERILRMAKENAEKRIRGHGVVVDDDGTFDIVRDMKWVYRHLSRLILRDDLGAEYLDPSILREAPSNGAIFLAEGAALNPKEFQAQCMSKLTPKDAAKKAAEDESAEVSQEDIAALDPDLSDFDNLTQ